MYPETDLVSLASPMFELVMRIRAEEITPSMELQKTIDEMLTQLEKRGKGLKYTEKQLETAKFALASYIDEMVLMAQFPFRDEWEKYPLQLKYFGEHLAGVKFFERLTEILRDPSRHGDLLELYYMCLLLGYKGRFRDYFEDELADVALYLIRLADVLDVDLNAAIASKLASNAAKYPVEASRGVRCTARSPTAAPPCSAVTRPSITPTRGSGVSAHRSAAPVAPSETSVSQVPSWYSGARTRSA